MRLLKASPVPPDSVESTDKFKENVPSLWLKVALVSNITEPVEVVSLPAIKVPPWQENPSPPTCRELEGEKLMVFEKVESMDIPETIKGVLIKQDPSPFTSKRAISETPGIEAPPAPPDVNDHAAGLVQSEPVVMIQYLKLTI
jgi:hypothetical protein